MAIARREAKNNVRIKPSHWEEIERLLRGCWSPEQISYRIKDEQGYQVSPEWIYQHVYEDKSTGGDLHTNLRCQKRRKKRYGKYDKRGKLANRRSIDTRPSVVEERTRIGDWESDLVIGKEHKGALLSMVERKSRMTILGNTQTKTASEVSEEIIKRLKGIKQSVTTITVDNGREFASHQEMERRLKAKIYFAHPYSSWERGTNENTNGLIRQYFPKSRRLDNVDEDELRRAELHLNHRPRKCLNWKTPIEVFSNTKTTLTVALSCCIHVSLFIFNLKKVFG